MKAPPDKLLSICCSVLMKPRLKKQLAQTLTAVFVVSILAQPREAKTPKIY
jgi:hypothetical protein